tara:strand:- start:278 stop:541 length:264 start_codon:yes stop_codon:yes gene_type:complete
MDSNRNFDIRLYGAVEQGDGSYIDRYGTITWYTEAGEYHNEDGPAIKYDGGSVSWCLNGLTYPSFDGWLIKLNKTDEQKLLLRLQYG